MPLTLDSISESTSPVSPLTPAVSSPLPNDLHGIPDTKIPHSPPGQPYSHSAHNQSTQGLGIAFGSPASRQMATPKPRSASSAAFAAQGAETLLWAYAQLSGTVEIDPGAVKEGSIGTLRLRLAQSTPVGGGRMDLYDQTRGKSDAGWSSWFSVPSLTSIRQASPAPTSFLSSLLSVRPNPTRTPDQASPDSPANVLSTFNPPQSMLAVDLNLLPGESKTCKTLFHL